MKTLRNRFSIAETTKVEREKIVNDALALSTLDAAEPTEQTKRLINQYIMGKMEISEILKRTISRYKVV